MRKCHLIPVCLVLLLLFPLSAVAKKKVLYVDSYHAGYEWSDGVTEGITTVMQDKNVEMKIFRMDTKRNPGEAYKKRAALDAKALIESFSPDVVIASDDNVSKYLILPYYKNADLPFVFCGVNHDGSAYGYPYKNATGMVEVAPMTKLVYSLKYFNRAEKIAMLIGDSLTDHKDAESYSKVIKLPFDTIHVEDFSAWKRAYVRIQDNYDILVMGNKASINGWDDDEALALVMSQTKIPTGCDLDFMAPFSLLAYTRVPQEQGRWAAETALKILDGAEPSSIPIASNVEGNLIINMKVAKAAGFNVPASFTKKATQVIE